MHRVMVIFVSVVSAFLWGLVLAQDILPDPPCHPKVSCVALKEGKCGTVTLEPKDPRACLKHVNKGMMSSD